MHRTNATDATTDAAVAPPGPRIDLAAVRCAAVAIKTAHDAIDMGLLVEGVTPTPKLLDYRALETAALKALGHGATADMRSTLRAWYAELVALDVADLARARSRDGWALEWRGDAAA